MGQISKEAYKKLVILYLISEFPDGVYTGYRFQKVLYFATKDSQSFPFTFQHTPHGQYSFNARENQNLLVNSGALLRTELPQEEEISARWVVSDWAHKLGKLFVSIDSKRASQIHAGIKKYGYLKSKDLVEQAENDELLKRTPRGQILFEENLPDMIDVDLGAEECQDLELSLNPSFINSMRQLIRGVDSGEISLEQWRKVDA